MVLMVEVFKSDKSRLILMIIEEFLPKSDFVLGIVAVMSTENAGTTYTIGLLRERFDSIYSAFD
jgi:hypothetical protein